MRNVKRKTPYNFFFPEGKSLPLPKIRWTVMILIQELGRGKYKAVFRCLWDSKYRKCICHLRDILSKGRLTGTKVFLPLRDIHFSHAINYPKWVEKLENEIRHPNTEEPYKRIKVFYDGNRYIVIDGNHRLQAMKNCYHPDTQIKALLLTYK